VFLIIIYAWQRNDDVLCRMVILTLGTVGGQLCRRKHNLAVYFKLPTALLSVILMWKLGRCFSELPLLPCP
jgi:hypothetical protein